eukprot:6747053-Lingulodinium_polyedra.AAC.1
MGSAAFDKAAWVGGVQPVRSACDFSGGPFGRLGYRGRGCQFGPFVLLRPGHADKDPLAQPVLRGRERGRR